MTCRLAEPRLVDYLDGEAGWLVRRIVERHLHACSRCREISDRLRATMQAIQTAMPTRRHQPPPGSWEKLVARLASPSCRRWANAQVWLRTAAVFSILMCLVGYWLLATSGGLRDKGQTHPHALPQPKTPGAIPAAGMATVPGHVGVVSAVDMPSLTVTVLTRPGVALTPGQRLEVTAPPDVRLPVRRFYLRVTASQGGLRYGCTLEADRHHQATATLSHIQPGWPVTRP